MNSIYMTNNGSRYDLTINEPYTAYSSIQHCHGSTNTSKARPSVSMADVKYGGHSSEDEEQDEASSTSEDLLPAVKYTDGYSHQAHIVRDIKEEGDSDYEANVTGLDLKSSCYPRTNHSNLRHSATSNAYRSSGGRYLNGDSTAGSDSRDHKTAQRDSDNSDTESKSYDSYRTSLDSEFDEAKRPIPIRCDTPSYELDSDPEYKMKWSDPDQVTACLEYSQGRDDTSRPQTSNSGGSSLRSRKSSSSDSHFSMWDPDRISANLIMYRRATLGGEAKDTTTLSSSEDAARSVSAESRMGRQGSGLAGYDETSHPGTDPADDTQARDSAAEGTTSLSSNTGEATSLHGRPTLLQRYDNQRCAPPAVNGHSRYDQTTGNTACHDSTSTSSSARPQGGQSPSGRPKMWSRFTNSVKSAARSFASSNRSSRARSSNNSSLLYGPDDHSKGSYRSGAHGAWGDIRDIQPLSARAQTHSTWSSMRPHPDVMHPGTQARRDHASIVDNLSRHDDQSIKSAMERYTASLQARFDAEDELGPTESQLLSTVAEAHRAAVGGNQSSYSLMVDDNMHRTPASEMAWKRNLRAHRSSRNSSRLSWVTRHWKGWRGRR